jgi:hypothetical protein
MKCECGEYFDMRNLNELAKHLHKTNSRSKSFKAFTTPLQLTQYTL